MNRVKKIKRIIFPFSQAFSGKIILKVPQKCCGAKKRKKNELHNFFISLQVKYFFSFKVLLHLSSTDNHSNQKFKKNILEMINLWKPTI